MSLRPRNFFRRFAAKAFPGLITRNRVKCSFSTLTAITFVCVLLRKCERTCRDGVLPQKWVPLRVLLHVHVYVPIWPHTCCVDSLPPHTLRITARLPSLRPFITTDDFFPARIQVPCPISLQQPSVSGKASYITSGLFLFLEKSACVLPSDQQGPRGLIRAGPNEGRFSTEC